MAAVAGKGSINRVLARSGGWYRTIVKLIAATTSTAGLTVKVRLDRRKYRKGLKVSEAALKQLDLRKHDFRGEWNYTITPRKEARTIK